jgi:hypothetical protein
LTFQTLQTGDLVRFEIRTAAGTSSTQQWVLSAAGASRPMSLPRCRSQRIPGAIATMREIYNAEDIDKTHVSDDVVV